MIKQLNLKRTPGEDFLAPGLFSFVLCPPNITFLLYSLIIILLTLTAKYHNHPNNISKILSFEQARAKRSTLFGEPFY